MRWETGLEPSVPGHRLAVGATAGLFPGILLATAVSPAALGPPLGVVLGALYVLAVRPHEGTSIDGAFTAGALAVLAWATLGASALPLAAGEGPAWSPAAIGPLLPAFATWVLAGVLLGVLVPTARELVAALLGPEPDPGDDPAVETRIVVLGGGFAGLGASKRLEERFGPDPTVDLTMVSEANAVLFTPLLAEVAAGSVEPSHITSPLRTSLRRTRVVRDRAVGVDVEAGTLRLSDAERPLPYDHLVLAPGSVPDPKGIDEDREFVFDFKSLHDAVAIRNHVIDCFERAETAVDPARRRSLVTFVVAGAGFAGSELAGALNDFVRGTTVHYPSIPPEEVRVVVVHSRERIMPELSESLAAYARERMADRGVTFLLGERVADAGEGVVTLSSGESIESETLVWTAGNRPSPFVERLDVPKTDRDEVRVDATLAVEGRTGLWAAGDCAAMFDAETDERYPNTAEHALRAGRVVADNVYASVTGGTTRGLSYRSPGSLAVIGHQTACAEITDLRFSGLFAWVLWRGVYLSKLPGTDRKVRVFADWLIAIFFPRDIVQTADTGREGR